MRRFLRAALIPIVLVTACGDDRDGGREVRLALDFQPNAVHAGVYAAIRAELDERRDLRLRVRVPSSTSDSLKLLAAGRAELALVDIHDLGLARARGADVVGVGAIVQRPLAAVIARRDAVRRPRDLEGLRVGVTGLPSDEAVLRSVVAGDGGQADRVERVTIGFAAVPALVAGRVDAVVSFWNAEGVALRRRGVRTREFRVDRFGAPRYPELVVATTRAILERRRALVADVLQVLSAGTRAALADRKASVEDLVRASGADAALARAQLDAVAPALRPPLRLDPAALGAWARFDTRFGILPRRPDVERAFETDLTGG